MSDFVEVKTAELTGAALDWAVAKVEGVDYRHAGIQCRTRLTGRTFHHYTKPNFMPSTDWGQGGPLLTRFNIDLTVERKDLIYASVCDDSGMPVMPGEVNGEFGPTHLIAACRAIVASVLGETVSVPKELMS